MIPSHEVPQKGSVEQKQETAKAALIEQLKKTPIVQVVCEKTGVSRASFYRWKKDDPAFAEAVDAALLDGSLLVNDMAESQLVSAIRDKNLTAIIFWLKAHHLAYATKVEVSRAKENDELTPEQQAAVERVLQLVREGYGK